MDQKTVHKLEREFEKAIAGIVSAMGFSISRYCRPSRPCT